MKILTELSFIPKIDIHMDITMELQDWEFMLEVLRDSQGTEIEHFKPYNVMSRHIKEIKEKLQYSVSLEEKIVKEEDK
jgi:hypothetical protein